ncbi:MAG: glutamate synthase [Clostridia bacterium]|nr:glutamate synthase [Clostridia bacterium]
MVTINTNGMDHKALNEAIRNSDGNVILDNCCGQRFIAAGASDIHVTINGIPGNALGAYLNGAEILVNGNAQDAVGDTMNDGCVIINGNIGDAAGYAMRGGEIYVRGNAGYRAGIHMKEYKEKCPVLVVGGSCGSFLGEYQAGGKIIVLGLDDGKRIVSNFPCTGMHGGKVFLRTTGEDIKLPQGVTAELISGAALSEIAPFIHRFCVAFGTDEESILASTFLRITPDSRNPYKQMYVAN